jgi:hypothetical protein
MTAIFAVMLMAAAAMFAVIPLSEDSDAAPSATYNLNAVAGTYYSFDTNIPGNYSIPANTGWSLAASVPLGMSVNSGGDIVGTPLIPGYYGMNFYLNGVGNYTNTVNGNYVAVKLNVTGNPSASAGSQINGPVNVSLNAGSSVFNTYQKSTSYYEVINSIFQYYMTASNFDSIGVSGNSWAFEDYDIEGGVAITPVVLDFNNVSYSTSTSMFTNLAYSNGTLSYKFNPTTYGTYAVGLHVLEEGPGYGGGSSFILTNVFTYSVPLSVDDITVYAGQSINISNVTSGSDLSVSGVSWLSVSGTSIVGTAPSAPGTYNVTVTAGGSTDMFTVTVVAKLTFTSVPSNGVIAYAL